MSYDINLRAPKCGTCGKADDDALDMDPTYNLSPIFHAAVRGDDGIRGFDGKLARDTIADLVSASEFLNDPANQELLVSLEPSNGWGDLPGARKVIAEMLVAASSHPGYTWSIH